MKQISTFWQRLRQVDEQAAAFNPYYHFANQTLDRVVNRHRNDFSALVRRIKAVTRKPKS